MILGCQIRFAAGIALIMAGAGLHAEVNSRNFDPAVKPEVDFDNYANGGWKKANPIPPDRGGWASFSELDERNKAALKKILETAAKATQPNAVERRVGDFYRSGMDLAAIEAVGLRPLEPLLNRIKAYQGVEDAPGLFGRLHRVGVDAGFSFGSEQDPKNSAMRIAAVWQAGLGLPERDYYFREDEKSQKIREQYVAHVAKTLVLAGQLPDLAANEAEAVLRLETALARASKPNVDLRDPVANFHKMTVAELQKLTPHFDWMAYFAGLGIATPEVVDVGQPEFLQAWDKQLATVPVEVWRAYLRWQVLRAESSFLPTAFDNEHFDFYSRILNGVQQPQDRWKRVLGTLNSTIGEDLGQLYVAKHFPPESKAQMGALVANLRAAMRERLQTLEWMDAATRAEALKKLDAFTVKIGYPDKWIDYSKAGVDNGPYVANVMRAREFDRQRDWAKIGKPTDRGEWQMTPPTVNAYYDSSMNEIVFPAGILQPPFFDPKADAAVNYGAIGSIIGHELTHGFDDSGRQFDADGNLRDWWTPESAAKFKDRAAGIIKQYDGYVAVDDLRVNGALTQGENIADLGGAILAYAALQKALGDGPRAKIDGLTPEQRFFLSFAAAERSNDRPQSQRVRTLTNPHSVSHWRVNGPLSNMEEFWKTYNVPEGAPMRRSSPEQVIIW